MIHCVLNVFSEFWLHFAFDKALIVPVICVMVLRFLSPTRSMRFLKPV